MQRFPNARLTWAGCRLPLMAVGLLALVFLGPSGCGCGDSLPEFVRDRGIECCTRVWWYVPDDSDLYEDAVTVEIVSAAPLDPGTLIIDQEILQSPEMSSVSAGDDVWFEIRLRMEGDLEAGVNVQIRETATDLFRAAARFLWLGTCQATVDRSVTPADLTVKPASGVLGVDGGTTGGEFQCVVCGSSAPCCCTFQWVPPVDLLGTTVEIVPSPEAAEFALNAVVTPRVFTIDAQGYAPTFRVCLPLDHPVPGTLGFSFVDAEFPDVVYGGATLTYGRACYPDVEPHGDTVLYSTDCGKPPPCCCTIEWCPGFEVQPDVETTVDVVVVGASPGLSPVLTPTTLVVDGPGDLQAFSVCVEGNHPIGATLEIELRDHATGGLLGGTNLVYQQRCVPTVVPYSGTTIYTSDCGTPPPRCCCTIRYTDYTGEGPKELYAVIENADPSLAASVGPVVPAATGLDTALAIGQPYDFEVCVEQCHPFDAELTVRLYEVGTDVEIALVVLRYPSPCVPTIVTTSGGFGIFTVLCE